MKIQCCLKKRLLLDLTNNQTGVSYTGEVKEYWFPKYHSMKLFGWYRDKSHTFLNKLKVKVLYFWGKSP
jgi:hypothetical protein